jgi:hypothetical protein
VRLHDQGSGPTGARTAALSASSIPATESDGLSMNQSKTEKEHSGDNYIGKQDREWLPMSCPSKSSVFRSSR